MHCVILLEDKLFFATIHGMTRDLDYIVEVDGKKMMVDPNAVYLNAEIVKELNTAGELHRFI